MDVGTGDWIVKEDAEAVGETVSVVEDDAAVAEEEEEAVLAVEEGAIEIEELEGAREEEEEEAETLPSNAGTTNGTHRSILKSS
jgi:hypothetical protein